jgi:hypothetical protein
MSVLRVRPLLAAALAGAVLCAVAVVATAWLVFDVVGRREPGTPLAAALQSAAATESARLHQEWNLLSSRVDNVLARLLELSEQMVVPASAVPWIPGGCASSLPQGVLRVGVFDVERSAPLIFVERERDQCVDRLGVMALQAARGPPFPLPKEVARLALVAAAGVADAPEGMSAAVQVDRRSHLAVVRFARRQGHGVAFADVEMSALSVAPVTDARVDALLMVGTAPAGYVHGGPQQDRLPEALAGVSKGTTRALDLPGLAKTAASTAVLAWTHPDSDNATLAMGSAQVDLPSAVPELSLLVVVSVPAPSSIPSAGAQLVALFLTAAALWVLLVLLVTRRLSSALWQTAVDVRHAWLGLRDDDLGSRNDHERALLLMETLAERTEQIVSCAFGRNERFWAPAPIGRLLDLLRKRMRQDG